MANLEFLQKMPLSFYNKYIDYMFAGNQHLCVYIIHFYMNNPNSNGCFPMHDICLLSKKTVNKFLIISLLSLRNMFLKY